MSNSSRLILATAALGMAVLAARAAAPEGWFVAGSNPSNYDTGVDQNALNNARPSAYLKAKADAEGFGTLMQTFSASQYVGKRVRYSASVKAENVTRWSGLWMRIDGEPGASPLAFDNMQSRAIKGTPGWQPYEVVLDVPQKATAIAFGILLNGPGEVWLNSANIEVVGPGVAVTDQMKSRLDQPTNLSFER